MIVPHSVAFTAVLFYPTLKKKKYQNDSLCVHVNTVSDVSVVERNQM